jgi:hypothetical protein
VGKLTWPAFNQRRSEREGGGMATAPRVGKFVVLKICKERPPVKQGKRCLDGIFIKNGREIDQKISSVKCEAH